MNTTLPLALSRTDMNSVLEIGEKVMFLYKGHKLWEGDNITILKSDVQELNEFVFASKRLREMGR